MFARPGAGDSLVPHTLREVNGLAFLHRERARFHAGASLLFGRTLGPAAGDGVTIDVRGVPELTAVQAGPHGFTIGAFADAPALTAALPDLMDGDAGPHHIALRLALRDARAIVCGLGTTRTAPVDDVRLAPYELPVAIELPPLAPNLGIGERRRSTADGAASFEVFVAAALRISVLGRYERVRIAVLFDGAVRRATQAEERLERRPADPSQYGDAARLAAAAISPSDARTSSAARSVSPLVLAALRDADARARFPKVDP